MIFFTNDINLLKRYGYNSPHAALVATNTDVYVIIERWKLSNDDAKYLKYLSDYAYNDRCNIWDFQDDIINGIPREWVIEKAVLSGITLESALDKLKDFPLYIFPVTGTDLIEKFGMKQGKILGIVLKSLREKWFQSRFLMTKEELLKTITD
jgi:hypothetical protein